MSVSVSREGCICVSKSKLYLNFLPISLSRDGGICMRMRVGMAVSAYVSIGGFLSVPVSIGIAVSLPISLCRDGGICMYVLYIYVSWDGYLYLYSRESCICICTVRRAVSVSVQ
jgi:hypothetical protein